MKTKIAVAIAALSSAFVSSYFPSLSLTFVGAVFVVFLATGYARSRGGGLDPLNDLPNSIRILMALLSGYLTTFWGNFLSVSFAIALFITALLLNDEYQRRTFSSVISGRRGGTVALLGIDGSGKSSHAAALERWFLSRGYYCTLVPFHRYLFVEKLSRRKGVESHSVGARGGGNPLRPLLSAMDNLALLLLTSFGRGIEGRVVIYDRYIWSTYVKYKALGYPTAPLRLFYLLPRPRLAVVLDVPVSRSLSVIHARKDHIRYRESVLREEREEYLSIARRGGWPVLDGTRDFLTVQGELERIAAKSFPARSDSH